MAASVFTNAREGILICDPKGAILDVNEMFTRITGYSRAEVLGRNPRILKSGRQSEAFYSDMWRSLLENGHWSGEVWNKAKDGRVFPEMLTINAVYDRASKVQHYVALFSDVTESKEQERQPGAHGAFRRPHQSAQPRCSSPIVCSRPWPRRMAAAKPWPWPVSISTAFTPSTKTTARKSATSC
jgi:PAS domain S-box-containing protein